jgi:hypothetical protein
MKMSGISLIILVCAAALVSGVSAQDVDTTNGYVVRPAGDLKLPQVALPGSSGTISQGQAVYYSKYVPSGTTFLVPDLSWGAPSDSLTLTVFAPDATLGPFSDASDGIVNGRIYLHISKSSGLTPGTWNFRVYGEKVATARSYTFTV